MTIGGGDRPFLLPYSPLTAIDIAAGVGRGAPVMLWRVLYPLWEVELPGTRIIRRELEPLEATLLRAIREGAARTVPDLARLLGIDQDLLDRVLAVQQRIGHLTRTGNDLVLARLGINSLRDGLSYRRAELGRGTIYFDGFTHQPLPDPYGRQQMLDPTDRDGVEDQRFLALLTARAWDPLALKSVITGRTLPDVQPRKALLPMYLVATGTGAMIALTDTRERQDRFFEEQLTAALDQDPFLAAALAVAAPPLRAAANTWLAQHQLATGRVSITAAGELRVLLPAEAFQRDQKPLTLARIGEYELIADAGGGQVCLQLWCDDVAARQAAAEAQGRAARARQSDLTATQLAALQAQRATRLELAVSAVEARAPEPAGRRKKGSRT